MILLVEGKAGVGKDYRARIWAAMLNQENVSSRVASISDSTKREYEAASDANSDHLLGDRTYKKQH